jgi:DNA-binding CsgD family transcriptional regulator
MFSFKRFYIVATLLLFITLIFLYGVSIKNTSRINPTAISVAESSEVSSFLNQNKSLNFAGETFKLKLSLSSLNSQEQSVIEIDDSSLSRVAFVYRENGEFKVRNWFRFGSDRKVLSSKPYFIVDSRNISSVAYLVFTGTPYVNLPVKTYVLSDYFLEKNNEILLMVVTGMILIAILLCTLFIYLKLRNGYALFLFAYMLLCFCSTLLFNGFTDYFWPFINTYLTSHSLGLGLGLYLAILCLFVILYLKANPSHKYFTRVFYFFMVVSLVFLGMAFVVNSYLIMRCQVYFTLVINVFFMFCYPIVFRNYQKKEAYWLNYSAILFFSLLCLVYSSKYFIFLNSNIYLEIFQKLLFLSHVIFLFIAFILINKKNLLSVYLSERGHSILSVAESEVFEDNLLSSLSEREYEVLHLIADGLRDQEIADRLFVCNSTVKTHKRRIYTKLEINSKSKATQIYLQFTSKTMSFVNN